MNNVINKKTNCLNVNTFLSLQTAKFDFRARKVSFISWYRCDFLRSPIERGLKDFMSEAQKRENGWFSIP